MSVPNTNPVQRSPRHHQVVIVGGGIAGLAAAWSLRDRDVCLLEAEDRVGGRMKSVSRPPYWLNLGAHILTEEGPIGQLCGELDVPVVVPTGSFLTVAMSGRIVRAGSPLAMFLRLPLSLSARVSLAKVGLRIVAAQAGLLMHGSGSNTNARRASREGRSFADLLGKMHPDVGALMRVIANRIGGELHEISAYAGVTGFQDIWGGERANIVGGSETLPRALQAALGTRVQTGARVTQIEQNDKVVEVEYVRAGEQRSLRASACIVVTQAPVTHQLVPGLPKHQAEALASVRYTPFVVAGIFTAEERAMPWDDLYALAVPGRSFCMFFNPGNTVRGGEARRPGGSLVVYAVAERAAELLDLSDKAITDRYLKDLYDIFPQSRGIVREIVIQRWPLGTLLHSPRQASMLSALAQPWGRIHFAGDYVAEFGLGIEGSAETGYRAAEAVRPHLQ
ncbi:MAG: FAD-dependent oxidoreductase [Ardenticatenia bacterium]|nr:FAD-dependent oxidoreductase [Ardenticatenia bacterium]